MKKNDSQSLEISIAAPKQKKHKMDKIYSSILSHYSSTPSCTSEVVAVHTVPQIPAMPEVMFDTQISVVNADTLDTALEYVIAGKRTLLLNMANPDTPGGSPSIVGAQEEDLFRRTNLHKFLSYRLYPLHKRIVLSKGVEVIRQGLRKGYAPLETPQYVDIVSCAAVKNMRGGTSLSSADGHVMLSKIHELFHTAVKEGYTHLVLSAWGCGGFGCPPEHISRLFKTVLEAYKGHFESVIFAIWDENYPKSNYAVFKETLGV